MSAREVTKPGRDQSHPYEYQNSTHILQRINSNPFQSNLLIILSIIFAFLLLLLCYYEEVRDRIGEWKTIAVADCALSRKIAENAE